MEDSNQNQNQPTKLKRKKKDKDIPNKRKKRSDDDSDDESYDDILKMIFKHQVQPVEKSPNTVYLESLSRNKREKLLNLEKKIYSLNENKVPLRYKLLESNIPDTVKSQLLRKVDFYDTMNSNSSEYHKLTKFMNGLLKIPFGKLISLPVKRNDNPNRINRFITNLKDNLDHCIYGNDNAKNAIIRIVAKWITNPTSTTNSIGLCGPPGVGKTSLVKNGLSKALDLPFAFIPLGGSTNAAVIEGHDYTWEGSKWGKIVDVLMEKQCMNPIIFFDELDKVSGTKAGEEIFSILTHITDTTQNTNFCDKYFNGIDIDLSKCLFIFSFNDETKINPILKDRITIVNVNGFGTEEKIHIAKKFSIPKICDNIGIDIKHVDFLDEALYYIIKSYCKEEGVRKLEKCVEHILLQLNLYHITKNDTNGFNDVELKLPYKINTNVIEHFLTSIFGSTTNYEKIVTMYS